MAFNGVATIGMPQQSGGGGLVGCSPVNPNSCNQSALISVNTMPNNNAGGQPTVVLLSTPSPQHQVQQQQVSQQQQQSMGPGNGPLLVCTPNMQQQQQSLSNNNNNMMHQNQNGGVGSNISTIGGGGGNNTMIIDGPHNNKRLCTRMDNNNDSGHINQNNTVSTITTTTLTKLPTLTLPHVHPPPSQPFSIQSSSSSPASPLLSSVDLHSSGFQFNHLGSNASSSTEGGECNVQEGAHNVIMRDTTHHHQSTRILSIDGSPSNNHSSNNISNYSSSLICDCLTSHHPHHPNNHPAAHPHPHTSLSLITAKNNDHDYTRYPDDGDYNNSIKCCSPSHDEALHPQLLQQQQLLQGNVSAPCSTSSPSLLSSTLMAAGHRVTGQMASQVSNLD